jgi:hypothetical protein
MEIVASWAKTGKTGATDATRRRIRPTTAGSAIGYSECGARGGLGSTRRGTGGRPWVRRRLDGVECDGAGLWAERKVPCGRPATRCEGRWSGVGMAKGVRDCRVRLANNATTHGKRSRQVCPVVVEIVALGILLRGISGSSRRRAASWVVVDGESVRGVVVTGAGERSRVGGGIGAVVGHG